MQATIQVNEANFDQEVLGSDQPVLVDFYADWCGPCKMLAPALDDIAREHAGRLMIAKVNVDECPALAARYRVEALPTLVYFNRGEPRDRTVGLASKKTILARVHALRAAPLAG